MTPPITTVTEETQIQTNHHYDQYAVEQAIIKANNRKYRQTNNTPPMTTLVPILGFLGTTKHAQEILHGTYSPPSHLDPYTKKLLPEFAIPSHLPKSPSIGISFTTSEYKQGWAKMKE